MFCHQCEQTAKGIACEISGVCGKKPEVAALQDNLLYGLKGLAFFADKARGLGAKDPAFPGVVTGHHYHNLRMLRYNNNGP